MEKQTVKTFAFKNIIKAMEDIVALHRCGHTEESVKLFHSFLDQCKEQFTLAEDDAPIRKEVMGMRRPFGQGYWGQATGMSPEAYAAANNLRAMRDNISVGKPVSDERLMSEDNVPHTSGMSLAMICRLKHFPECQAAETRSQLVPPIVALDDGTPSDTYLGKLSTEIAIGHGNSHNREMLARGYGHELDSSGFDKPDNVPMVKPNNLELKQFQFGTYPCLFSMNELDQDNGKQEPMFHVFIAQLRAIELRVKSDVNKRFGSLADPFSVKIDPSLYLRSLAKSTHQFFMGNEQLWVESEGKTFYDNFRDYLKKNLPQCLEFTQTLERITNYVADFVIAQTLLDITKNVSLYTEDPILGSVAKYTAEYLSSLTVIELNDIAINIGKMYTYLPGACFPTPIYDTSNFSNWLAVERECVALISKKSK